MRTQHLHTDTRGLTPAITHTLTIAFTMILIIGLFIAANGFLETEQRDSVRQELSSIGNRLADEIDRVDNLAQQGSNVSIMTNHPADITGGGYSVTHAPAGECGPDVANRSCLILDSFGTDVTVDVRVVNQTTIEFRRVDDGVFNITSRDPTSAMVATERDSSGLSLRVGVGSNIREDPLGSRLTTRNFPPIPLFDVEPVPVTTARTHFLNGSASLDQDGNVTDWKWDIGDDGLYTHAGEISPHWFENPGRQEVTLRVADDAEDTASTILTKNVTVSGLEYNQDLRTGVSSESIRFSFYNNWSNEVRLDSLFIDDLDNNVAELGNCDDYPYPSDTFNSEVNIDVDSSGDRDTYVEYDDGDWVWTGPSSGYWDCDPGVPFPNPGLTINVDQTIPDAETSAPGTVPVVDPGDHVTIEISGLDSNLEDTNWRLGVAYLVGGQGAETVFADRVGAPHVSNLTMVGDGSDLTVSFESDVQLDNIELDGLPGSPITETAFGTPTSTGLGTWRYEYTATGVDTGNYTAALSTAEESGISAYDLPLSDSAVAVDDSDDAVWNTAQDWDNVTDAAGVVHEGFGDHAADEISLGYPWNDTNGDNLTAYWAMDEDTGTMTDVSFAGSNDGSTTDVFDETVGIFGTSSYAFTSGSSRVDSITSTNALSGGDDQTITVSTWIHPREAIANSNGAAVIGKLNATTGGDWGIVINSTCPGYADDGCDGTPAIGYYGGTETDEFALMHGPVTQPDAWHHVAFVLDGANDELDLYFDGRVVETTDSFPDYASANTSNGIRIGEHNGTGNNFDGYVDETRIYNRSLSGSQVRQLADTSVVGTFRTDWKNTSATVDPNDLNLTASARLNGGDVTVRVESDHGDLSDPITLTSDYGTYEVTGLPNDADGYRLEITVESGSKNLSPIIDSLAVGEDP